LKLRTVVRFLDDALKIGDFPGDSSLNGLQVEGSSRIEKIALAVDACERSISRAIATGADMLIVHHGLFWGEMSPITGIAAKRIGLLLGNGLSLYAAHLPLDCHPEFGNNAQLADLLGVEERESFGTYHGIKIALCGLLPRPITPKSLAAKLRKLLKAPVRIFPFGGRAIGKIGIVSGGGAFLAQEAAELGCHALLTGETSHSAFHTARDAGVNLICAGHYATETLGIKALGRLAGNELKLPVRFLDIPTGL
jgi:dinuclear metal center YbgI/SA1388 family protein